MLSDGASRGTWYPSKIEKHLAVPKTDTCTIAVLCEMMVVKNYAIYYVFKLDLAQNAMAWHANNIINSNKLAPAKGHHIHHQ